MSLIRYDNGRVVWKDLWLIDLYRLRCDLPAQGVMNIRDHVFGVLREIGFKDEGGVLRLSDGSGRYVEAIWDLSLGQDSLRLRNAYTLSFVDSVKDLFDLIRTLWSEDKYESNL